MSLQLADVIAPLLFPLGIQLLLANFLIAYIEILVVRWRFGFRSRRLYWLTFFGNAVSAIVGAIILSMITQGVAPLLLGDDPLRHVWRVVLFIPMAAFVLSVLIEWPFFHAALAPPDQRPSRTVVICTLAQIASYAMLLPFYAGFATNTIGRWSIVSPQQIAGNDHATLLYVSGENGELYETPLAGGASRPLPHGRRSHDRSSAHALQLFADGDHVDLRLHRWGDSIEALGQFAATKDACHRYDEDICGGGDPNFNATDLRAKDQRQRDFYASPFGGGLSEMTRQSEFHYGHERLLAFDVLWLSWAARCATILPGDRVALQLGDQIVIADVPTHRVAILARGQSPAVAWELEPASFIAGQPTTQMAIRKE